MSRNYLHRIFYSLLLYVLTTFMIFVIIGGLDTFQKILLIPIIYLIFRSFLQLVSVKLLSDILFLFSEKKYEIIEYERGNYSIIKTFKKDYRYNPFYYSNKAIDYCFSKIVSYTSDRTRVYNTKTIYLNAKIWIKNDLTKKSATVELQKIIRTEKFKKFI